VRRSTLIAALIALAVAGWLASPYLGLGGSGDDAGNAPVVQGSAAEPEAPNDRLTAVRTRISTAEPMAREVALNGRTEANRTVLIAAETSGRVVELLKEKGQRVAAGEVLARLDRRDREAAVLEAQASLEQRMIEYEAASRLGERGFQAQTRVAEAKAALELARYNLRRAEVALSHTEITAPFGGALEEQPVELGSFVDIGDPLARIVDLDPIIVVTDVPEASIHHLSVGETAEIRLVDGSHHEGRVRFVARQAKEQTRTFRVEIEVPNPDAAVPAGISTEVAIVLEPVPTHRVSPGILVLDDSGVLGIKSVDDDATVVFHAADIVRAEADAIWLHGLPDRLRIITVGQGFVSPGQRVEATDEAAVATLLDIPPEEPGAVR
jgi:multidrug efflux system membrane fusion protein